MSTSEDPKQVRPQRTATSQKMLEAVLAKRLNLDNDTVTAVVNELQVLLLQITKEGGRAKLDHMGVFERAKGASQRVNFLYAPKR